MRKRTKTGCLTCRKRRIKCGEERPTCANCIKSKRNCEGYNQRVVFKPPIGDWPNHPGVVTNLQFHTSTLPGSRTVYRGGLPTTQAQEASQPASSRQYTQYEFSNVDSGAVHAIDHLNTQQVLVGGPAPYHQDAGYQQPLHSPHHQQPLHSPHHHQLPTPTSATSYFPSLPSPANNIFPYSNSGSVGYDAQQKYHGQYQHIAGSYDSPIDHKPTASQAPSVQPVYQQRMAEEQGAYMLHSHAPPRAESYPQYPDQHSAYSGYGGNLQGAGQQPQLTHVDYSQGGQYVPLSATSHAGSTHSNHQPAQIPPLDVIPDVKYMPQHAPILGMSRV